MFGSSSSFVNVSGLVLKNCWPAAVCSTGSRFSIRPASCLCFVEHGVLGRLEHAVEAADHRQRQDHLAVLGLLVVAAQQVGHGPDEGGVVADVLALGTGSA